MMAKKNRPYSDVTANGQTLQISDGTGSFGQTKLERNEGADVWGHDLSQRTGFDVSPMANWIEVGASEQYISDDTIHWNFNGQCGKAPV